mmetsp:Transcript_67160/g.162269  ORF Transcript_67160/g.162269 Transcript_67160/m.162269 type:complete len:305 (+) Transcript_67160:987-1901(+)
MPRGGHPSKGEECRGRGTSLTQRVARLAPHAQRGGKQLAQQLGLRGHGARAVCDEDEGLAEGDLLVEGEAARGEGGAHTRQHLGGGHAGDHGGGRILGQAQQADAQPPPHVLRRHRGGGQATARRHRRGELQVVRREVIELRPELREVGGERCGGAHEAPARGERAEELRAPHLERRVLRSPLEEATRQARRLDAAAAQRGARRLSVLVGGVLRRGRGLHLLAHRLEDDGGRVEAQYRGRAAHVAVHLAPGLERGRRQRGGRRGGRWVLHGLRRGRGGVAQRVGQRGGGREGGEQPRHLQQARA